MAERMIAERVADGMSEPDAFRAVGEEIGDQQPEAPTDDPAAFAGELSIYLDERPPGAGNLLVPR